MVVEWVELLAASGGSALVGAAATDAWESTRAAVVRLFRRVGGKRQESVAIQLDEDATAIEEAEAGARDRIRQDLLPAWQTRLADLLIDYPDAADELRMLISNVQALLPSAGEIHFGPPAHYGSGSINQAGHDINITTELERKRGN